MIIDSAQSRRFLVDDERLIMEYKIDKRAYEAAKIFNDELLESKEVQMQYSLLIYENKLEAELVGRLYMPSQFCKCDVESWRRHINGIKGKVLGVSPLDILCAITISKRTKKYIGKGNDTSIKFMPTTKSPNDIALENGIVFELLKRELSDKKIFDTGGDCVVFSPTPFFVRTWEQDTLLNKIRVKFVMNSKLEKELLEKHYRNSHYCGMVRDNILFSYYAESKLTLEQYGSDSTEWLFFVNNDRNGMQKRIIKDSIIGDGRKVKSALAFGSDKDLVEMCINNIKISNILILPRGVSKGADSKDKSIWQFSKKEEPNSLDIINACKGIKYVEQGNVYIKYPKCNVPVKMFSDEFKTCLSLRAVYNEKTNNIKERQRNQRSEIKRLTFTPEIIIGYNSSNYKKDSSKENIQAFFLVCEDETEANGFYKEEKIIDSTKYKILEKDQTINWILQEYPFSNIDRRALKHEMGKSVRHIVSGYYKEQLEEKNISLRTLWFIYPEMSDIYQGNEYEELKDIAFSEVGNKKVDDFTEDYYIYLYREYYANETETEKNRKFGLISHAISFACEHNHCSMNVIDSILTSSKSEEYTFSLIRKSFTKKNFSVREFHKIYEIIVEKLSNGNSEYLGVMIKLFLGLESNCICALTVSDFVKVNELNFYQILIYKQETNDGKEEKPLKENYDYRYLPCSEVLANFLIKHVENQKEIYPEEYESMALIADKNNRKISPMELDRISRDLLAELGMPDILMIIPLSNKGIKETNLGRYFGDIYRSNCLYWLQHYARMTSDEKQYFFGNLAATTFGRHYCDFSHDLVQYSMFVKLRRIDAILVKSCIDLENRVIKVEDGYTYKAVDGLPLRANMIANISPDHLCEIRISNKYGFRVQVNTYGKRLD